MIEHVKLYTKIDSDGELIMPLETVNIACVKDAGGRCLVNDKVDEEYYAKKQFGEGNYKAVEFEKDVPMFHFTGTVTQGKADKDQKLIDEDKNLKTAQKQKSVQRDWVVSIINGLDLVNEKQWTTAEKKLSRNIYPTLDDFKEHNATFKHD